MRYSHLVTRPVRVGGIRSDSEEGWMSSLPFKGKWNQTVYTSRDDCPIGWAYAKSNPLEQPTPSNHRSTLVFDSEVPEMHDVGIQLLPALLGGDEYIHEFSYGKAGGTRYSTDLVVVEIDRAGLRRRLDIADSASLTSRTNRVYGYWDIYSRGRYSRRNFVEDGKYVESTAKGVWNWLEEHGWIASSPTGYATVVPYPSWTTVHAIELKQRKYAEAKQQVERSSDRSSDGITGYADYRWVALDAGTLEPALESDEFGQHPDGIGLIALDNGGAVILKEATTTNLFVDDRITRDRLWLEESVLDLIDPEAYLEAWGPVPEASPEKAGPVRLDAFADGGKS